VIGAVLIDQLNLCIADFIVGARPVLGGGGRGSIGTANGVFSKVVKGRRQSEGLSAAGQANSLIRVENHQMRGILVTPVMPKLPAEPT
jgi:hypothetical protein